MKYSEQVKCKNCRYSRSTSIINKNSCSRIIRDIPTDYDYVYVEDDWFCGYFEN